MRQDFNLIPEKFTLVHPLNTNENDPDQFEIIKDIRDNNTINNYLAIPTPEEIMSLDSYTLDEMDEMLRKFNGLNIKITKAFQKELDDVVHPSQDYSSSDAHHQPHFQQSEGLEQSIKDMFTEFESVHYNPENHEENAVEGDADIYKMSSHHGFKGWIKLDTFLYKMLAYYTFMYRIFKLEYFTWKASSNPIDVLNLERYVFNGSNYWKIIENREKEAAEEELDFELYSDSDDSGIDKNAVSKVIIKRIVDERRRRVKLQDDLENLHVAINGFLKNIDALPEKNLNTILEYITLYHDNRFVKVIFWIDKVLERLYDNPSSKEPELSRTKQIRSLQSLSKLLSNRDRNIIPWFNYRYYGNFQEYYFKTKEIIDEQAMNPKEISKLEQIYPDIRFSKNVFSGQKIGHPYAWLDYEILDLTKENRSYIQSWSNTLRGIVSDYLIEFNINRKGSADLRERNDIIKTFIMRTQLKFALFSWYSCSDFPQTPDQYHQLSFKFRNDLYKKVLEQKTYLKSIEPVVGQIKLDTSTHDIDMALTPLEKEKIK